MKLGRRAHFIGHGRKRLWWLILAAVLAAMLWATAQVLGWPVWARAVLAGLAAAVALIVPELRAWFVQRETWAQWVDQRVRVSGGHGRLPRVQDVELKQLGVHPARVQVPFIERDQQDKLDERIGPGRAALVVGHSMSGKTRLAAEVIKRKLPDALLLFAESGKALRELFDKELDPAGMVVWLDDLEEFLGVDGLTVGLLNRLSAGKAIVVATIQVGQREMYRPRDQLRPPPGWDVLQHFNEISLQRRLTNPELDRVRAMVTDPGVLAAMDHYGLAEYLGAGPDALDTFEKGEVTNPVGHALVRAAIDWRRVGFTRPISQQILTTALPTYLTDRSDVPRTNQAIDDGLMWATAKINETVALLGQVFTDSNGPVFEAFDYLIDQPTCASTPIPDSIWALALKQADPDELFVISLAAFRQDKQPTAKTALLQAIDKDDSGVMLRGVIDLSQLMQKTIDLGRAKTAYHQAIESGNAEGASTAAFDLERLLEGQGNLEEAKDFYLQAIESSDADLAPIAAANYWRLRQNHLEKTKAFYHQTIAESGGDAKLARRAAIKRWRRQQEQGNLEEVKDFYLQAIESGDADLAPRAAVNLGHLLQKQGDLAGAKAAYQRAIESGHTEWVPIAAAYLERQPRSTLPPVV
jgi:tetratricopeptide (TPR) repeat protein